MTWSELSVKQSPGLLVESDCMDGCSTDGLTTHEGRGVVGSGADEDVAVDSSAHVPNAEDDLANDSFTAEKSSGEGQRFSASSMNSSTWADSLKPITILLGIIAALSVAFTLYAAREIILPITTAILLALTLRPVVRYLKRRQVPELVSAFGLLASMIVFVALGFGFLIGPAEDWMKSTPQKIREARQKLDPVFERFTGWMQASSRVEALTHSEAVDEKPMPVEIKQSAISKNLAVANVTGGFLGAVVLVLAMSFFILFNGDRFLNNVLRTLPQLSQKRIAVELVHEVELGIASYLFTVTCINLVMGLIATILAFLSGLPNPLLWGVMVCLFNYIPLFGPMVAFAILSIVSILSIEPIGYAFIPPVIFASISMVEGNLVTPALLGKSMNLHPIVVLISLTFWGWIWGLTGAIIAIPLLAVFKIICEKFDETKPLAMMLEG